jgi:hypothetical protein
LCIEDFVTPVTSRHGVIVIDPALARSIDHTMEKPCKSMFDFYLKLAVRGRSLTAEGEEQRCPE